MELEEVSFDRPIPGQGMTSELGARPWEKPPQYTTVDEALSYYLPKLSDDEFAKNLINVMEMGVPITSLANTIQMSSVMEGRHSVDVGILILPVLIEAMRFIGDSANIEYVVGNEGKKSKVDDDLAKRVATEMNLNHEEDSVDVAIEDTPVEVEEEVTTGLMARRK